MDFKTATLGQLHLIVSNYETCPLSLKLQAKAEIERRKKLKFGRKNWRRKEHPA